MKVFYLGEQWLLTINDDGSIKTNPEITELNWVKK